MVNCEALFRAAWISNDTHYIFFIIWSSVNPLLAEVSTETPHGYLVLYAHAASQDFQTHSHNASQISSDVLAVLDGTSDVSTEQPEKDLQLETEQVHLLLSITTGMPWFYIVRAGSEYQSFFPNNRQDVNVLVHDHDSLSKTWNWCVV